MKDSRVASTKRANGRPGAGWEDLPEDASVLAELADRVGQQQKKVAAGCPALHGRIGRGQHQKQLLGAFGTLRVRDALPFEAKLGPFAHPGAFRVACRISNGQPCPFGDRAPDVRGVALKFFAGGEVETDFVMTNEGGRSHARSALEFTDVADILAALATVGGQIDAIKTFFKYLLDGSLGPVAAARVAAILGKETVLHKVQSMMTEHYWGSVVKLGDAAVKYSLHPHASTQSGTDGDAKSDDYLRNDLLNRIARAPLRYELGLQFFVDEKTTPVNDASVAWKAPLVVVGEIDIPTKPSAADERLIDQMAFNPTHGFEPLGITHVRGLAYAASAKNRGALTTDEVRPYFAVAGPKHASVLS
jgi:catalase